MSLQLKKALAKVEPEEIKCTVPGNSARTARREPKLMVRDPTPPPPNEPPQARLRKKFQVIIDRSFPLAEARAAQRHLEGRGHFGKVVPNMS
jgi:Zinc-binding dehydrogenase